MSLAERDITIHYDEFMGPIRDKFRHLQSELEDIKSSLPKTPEDFKVGLIQASSLNVEKVKRPEDTLDRAVEYLMRVDAELEIEIPIKKETVKAKKQVLTKNKDIYQAVLKADPSLARNKNNRKRSGATIVSMALAAWYKGHGPQAALEPEVVSQISDYFQELTEYKGILKTRSKLKSDGADYLAWSNYMFNPLRTFGYLQEIEDLASRYSLARTDIKALSGSGHDAEVLGLEAEKREVVARLRVLKTYVPRELLGYRAKKPLFEEFAQEAKERGEVIDLSKMLTREDKRVFNKKPKDEPSRWEVLQRDEKIKAIGAKIVPTVLMFKVLASPFGHIALPEVQELRVPPSHISVIEQQNEERRLIIEAIEIASEKHAPIPVDVVVHTMFAPQDPDYTPVIKKAQKATEDLLRFEKENVQISTVGDLEKEEQKLQLEMEASRRNRWEMQDAWAKEEEVLREAISFRTREEIKKLAADTARKESERKAEEAKIETEKQRQREVEEKQAAEHAYWSLGENVPRQIKQWEPLIVKYAKKYGLDPKLVAAVMMTESKGVQHALSPAGAVGLMQVMGGSYDPEANIARGCELLAWGFQKFGQYELALASYNAGPGNVERYKGIPPFKETYKHIALTTEYYNLYKS